MAPRHVLPFVVPLALITVGTVGYSVIEDWPARDSFYMTVITLSTVSFGEVHPLSEEGREFTVVLVLGGVFALFYVATEGMRAIFGGEIQKLLGRQRVEKNLAELKGHLLVCGFGRPNPRPAPRAEGANAGERRLVEWKPRIRFGRSWSGVFGGTSASTSAVSAASSFDEG